MTRMRSLSTSLLLLFIGLFGRDECRQIASSGGNMNLPASQRPVELAWGIADVQTPVGRLFNFTIPKDAFEGQITDMKVTETGRTSLPAWLTFDPVHLRFIGLPVDTKEIGSLYVSVTAVGAQGSSAQDVFAITVKDSSPESQCTSDAAETILGILLDVDFLKMTMEERVALLNKFSNYMDVPVAQFKVSLADSGSATGLLDVSALMAGPGNAKDVKHSGIKLSTIVGCDGEVSGSHNKELVAFVEEAAVEGSMANFTGIDVVGWLLTTSKPIKPSRVRRQNNFLNTPEPSPIVPTMVEVPTTPVVSTPYLQNVPAINEVVDVTDPEIKPTGRTELTVKPTATVQTDGTTPKLEMTTEQPTPTPPPLPPPTKPARTKKPTTTVPPPKIADPLLGGTKLIFVAGERVEYTLPENTFGPQADRTLAVKIFEHDKASWLTVQTDEKGVSKLVGLPLSDAVGDHTFHLEGRNEFDGMVHVPFNIRVQDLGNKERTLNHEFEVVLDEPYDRFDLSRRLRFVDAIRSYYNDPDTTKIVLRSIRPGSTHVSWANQSLFSSDCTNESLKSVIAGMQDDQDKVNPDFEAKMKENEFLVQKVVVKKLGPCAEGATGAQKSESDVLLAAILPIAVVASLLLLACCIGCFLYRKKRRGKMTTEGDPIFTGKNKPVILPGEISDNGSKGAGGPSKRPAVLSEERQPVPPPQYPGRSPTPGRGQAPRANDDEQPGEQHPLLRLQGDPSRGAHLELVESPRR